MSRNLIISNSILEMLQQSTPGVPASNAYKLYFKSDGKLHILDHAGNEYLAGPAVPGSSTNNALVRWDGTGAVGLKDSGITLSDAGILSSINGLTLAPSLGNGVKLDFTASSAGYLNVYGQAPYVIMDTPGAGGQLRINAEGYPYFSLTSGYIKMFPDETVVNHALVFGADNLHLIGLPSGFRPSTVYVGTGGVNIGSFAGESGTLTLGASLASITSNATGDLILKPITAKKLIVTTDLNNWDTFVVEPNGATLDINFLYSYPSYMGYVGFNNDDYHVFGKGRDGSFRRPKWCYIGSGSLDIGTDTSESGTINLGATSASVVGNSLGDIILTPTGTRQVIVASDLLISESNTGTLYLGSGGARIYGSSAELMRLSPADGWGSITLSTGNDGDILLFEQFSGVVGHLAVGASGRDNVHVIGKNNNGDLRRPAELYIGTGGLEIGTKDDAVETGYFRLGSDGSSNHNAITGDNVNGITLSPIDSCGVKFLMGASGGSLWIDWGFGKVWRMGAGGNNSTFVFQPPSDITSCSWKFLSQSSGYNNIYVFKFGNTEQTSLGWSAFGATLDTNTPRFTFALQGLKCIELDDYADIALLGDTTRSHYLYFLNDDRDVIGKIHTGVLRRPTSMFLGSTGLYIGTKAGEAGNIYLGASNASIVGDSTGNLDITLPTTKTMDWNLGTTGYSKTFNWSMPDSDTLKLLLPAPNNYFSTFTVQGASGTYTSLVVQTQSHGSLRMGSGTYGIGYFGPSGFGLGFSQTPRSMIFTDPGGGNTADICFFSDSLSQGAYTNYITFGTFWYENTTIIGKVRGASTPYQRAKELYMGSLIEAGTKDYWGETGTIRLGSNANAQHASIVGDGTTDLTIGMTAVASEVQRLQWSTEPSSGTFLLSLDGSEWTSAIAYNASAGAVQTAVGALSQVGGTSNITVNKANRYGEGYGYIFSFIGAKAGINMPIFQVDVSSLPGVTPTITEMYAGDPAPRALKFAVDNQNDIGNAANYRPKNIYAGTSVAVGNTTEITDQQVWVGKSAAETGTLKLGVLGSDLVASATGNLTATTRVGSGAGYCDFKSDAASGSTYALRVFRPGNAYSIDLKWGGDQWPNIDVNNGAGLLNIMGVLSINSGQISCGADLAGGNTRNLGKAETANRFNGLYIRNAYVACASGGGATTESGSVNVGCYGGDTAYLARLMGDSVADVGKLYLGRNSTVITGNSGVTTIDATVTDLMTFATTTDRSILIEAHILGQRTGGSAGTNGDSAAYILRARVKNVGGVVSVNDLGGAEDEDQVAWDANLVADSPNVKIQVVGAINNTIIWKVTTFNQVG